MKRIGITGQSGFVGSHLYNTIGLDLKKYNRIEFDKSYFKSEVLMDEFVRNCDVIVHLAGVNRHHDPNELYKENLGLTSSLISSLERTHSKAHVIYSSSIQEDRDNLYGNAKKASRQQLANWALNSGSVFTGLIIPNVFGPFGRPNYNSVIATFCHQLTNDIKPKIDIDSSVNLIYVGDLVHEILGIVDSGLNDSSFILEHRKSITVSELLSMLTKFQTQYHFQGIIPELNDKFDVQLFNTFRSYESLDKKYPVQYIQHADMRGNFTELIKLNNGGQISFSTTHPGITRGNHFHTRKIERFSVIKGKARIQLRKIGTAQIFNFELDGDQPSYVDMPIWYTHNITNSGDTELYTVFWINEFYDANDPDTFFEIV